MIRQYIFFFVFVSSLSCNAQKESEEIVNAKWFYYAYAAELNGYSGSGVEMQPLACDIKINFINHVNTDTTKFYFSLYQKDTLNICYLKPLGLTGIMVVGNKLYLPVYHSIVFDSESDSVVLETMKKQSLSLRKKVLENKEAANLWLQAEAEKRQ